MEHPCMTNATGAMHIANATDATNIANATGARAGHARTTPKRKVSQVNPDGAGGICKKVDVEGTLLKCGADYGERNQGGGHGGSQGGGQGGQGGSQGGGQGGQGGAQGGGQGGQGGAQGGAQGGGQVGAQGGAQGGGVQGGGQVGAQGKESRLTWTPPLENQATTAVDLLALVLRFDAPRLTPTQLAYLDPRHIQMQHVPAAAGHNGEDKGQAVTAKVKAEDKGDIQNEAQPLAELLRRSTGHGVLHARRRLMQAHTLFTEVYCHLFDNYDAPRPGETPLDAFRRAQTAPPHDLEELRNACKNVRLAFDAFRTSLHAAAWQSW